MAPKSSISVSLTRRDFEDFAVFAAFDGPFAGTIVFRRIQILLLPLAAVLLLLLLVFNLDPLALGGGAFGDVSLWPRWVVLALAAAVAAIWIGLPFAVRVWVRRGISSPQYDSLLLPVQLSLSSAGVTADNAGGEVVTPWQAMRAVTVVNAAIYAFIAPFQAIIIPRRVFSDTAAFDDFIAELSFYEAQAGIDWTLTKNVRSPRRVFVASALGASVALILVALCFCYVETTERYFIAAFDENLKGAPVEAAIIQLDPGFRDRVLRATSEAFSAGGWNAANDELHALMSAKQLEVTWAYVHADDQFVLGLWRAYRDVGKALASNPTACRSYLNDGGEPPADFYGARSSVAQKAAAYRSGAANLANGTAPIIPSDQIARSLFDRAMAIGTLYSVAEWNVVAHKAAELHSTPDAVVCTARIKFFDKILSLPDHDAAQLIRYEWGQSIAWKFS